MRRVSGADLGVYGSHQRSRDAHFRQLKPGFQLVRIVETEGNQMETRKKSILLKMLLDVISGLENPKIEKLFKFWNPRIEKSKIRNRKTFLKSSLNLNSFLHEFY